MTPAFPAHNRRLLVTALFVVFAVCAALVMALCTSAGLRDYLTLVALVIASLALVQNWTSSSAAIESAELSRLAEHRKKYGWSIQLHPDGGSYVLRNTGTVTATDVKLLVPGKGGRAAFLQVDGEGGPTIRPNQSKGFRASFPWTSSGTEIQVDWLPRGDGKRQTHVDVVQPTPDRVAEFQTRQRQLLEGQHAAEDEAIRRYEAECRGLLLDLAEAWGTFQEDATAANKLRVQAIVGALPTNFAREIGYQVDVPRDYWGEHQWPPENWVPDDPRDQVLLRENAAIIELIWNLRQVQIPKFVEIDLSQSPEPWPRIERAIYGFRDLVRGRESGHREVRDGERDREHRAAVQKRFEEMKRIEADGGTADRPV